MSQKPGNLKKHIKNVHEQLKNHQCDLCDKVFSESRSLKKHTKAVHFVNMETSVGTQ